TITSTSTRGAFFMGFVVYIIYSQSADRYYVGHCQDLSERLARHNGGRSKYTKMARDWELRWSEEFPGRAAAMARERAIKRKKSRVYIEHLISVG
ncbi:GIY-YIG nuclease family protein, partial [Flagellimonas myxillae]|uniref:GIY-YIG nuclease family protein n=1 Tax=Flagellimonas myxillae TaxID=2942214 RepID=UPI00201EA19D